MMPTIQALWKQLLERISSISVSWVQEIAVLVTLAAIVLMVFIVIFLWETLSHWFNIVTSYVYTGTRGKWEDKTKDSTIEKLRNMFDYETIQRDCRKSKQTANSAEKELGRQTQQITSHQERITAIYKERQQVNKVLEVRDWVFGAEIAVPVQLGRQITQRAYHQSIHKLKERREGMRRRLEECREELGEVCNLLGLPRILDADNIDPPASDNGATEYGPGDESTEEGDLGQMPEKLQKVVIQKEREVSQVRDRVREYQEKWAKLLDKIRESLLPRLDEELDDADSESEIRDKLAEGHVRVISPERGDKSDPGRHEEFTRASATDECPPGHVIRVIKPGYEWRATVLRRAQIAVAVEDADDGGDEQS